RKFDSLGNPLTIEQDLHFFGVPEGEPAAVRLPIAGQADGLAVAFSVTGDLHDVWLVRFDAAFGGLAGNPIVIDRVDNVDHPSITSFSNGSVWVSYTLHNSATDSDILAKRVDAAGNVSAVIPIFTDAANTLADFSDLTTLVNGNVVAVFQADAGNGD